MNSITEIEKKIKNNIITAPYTTFKIGGPARYFLEPENLKDIKASIRWALIKKIPFFILGGGANVLIHDDGFNGLIINTTKLNKIDIDKAIISAECGVMVDKLVNFTLNHSFSGIEFASGLPGTVGGAIYMNARCFDSSFSDITQRVIALKIVKNEVREISLNNKDIKFSYKSSIFQKKTYCIYKVFFTVKKSKPEKIQNKINKYKKIRREKGQYYFPNAGCIFKNNYEIANPTGKIIEELGLKGKRIGDAEVYKEHANFIINKGNAKARDVYKLIKLVENEVYEKRGIKLEKEIILLGDWSC